MEIFVIITVCVTILVATVFFLGPKILEAFFDKVDEWADIIDSMKGEK